MKDFLFNLGVKVQPRLSRVTLRFWMRVDNQRERRGGWLMIAARPFRIRAGRDPGID